MTTNQSSKLDFSHCNRVKSIADYHALNTLPTYENVLTVYTDLGLPPVNFI
jgi:hypothetical protein